MPKPVKKAKKKSTTPKRPSSDPVRRAKQTFDEHLAKLSQGKWAKDFAPAGVTATHGPETEHETQATPSDMEKFEALYKARMAALGRKGGQVSGAKRMEMPEKQRKAIAKKAAEARWGKKAKQP